MFLDRLRASLIREALSLSRNIYVPLTFSKINVVWQFCTIKVSIRMDAD